jgi:hypothetical protein
MLTAHQNRAFLLLVAAADMAAPCPTNGEISAEIGYGDDRGGSDMVTSLQLKGLLLVEQTPKGRRITIVSTGKSTGVRNRRPSLQGVSVDHGYRGPVPEQQRVDREPCGFCGVRADHGCRHQRMAA